MGSYKYSGVPEFVQVNQSGTFQITSYGAQGGGYNNGGGFGAEIGGSFYLKAGTTLEVIVGGQGQTGSGDAGGGGGTFIYEVNGGGSYTLLMAAGGGGGGKGGFGGKQYGGAGTVGSPGNGSGGAGVSYAPSGGGGAGAHSNGQTGAVAFSSTTFTATGGYNRSGSFAGGRSYNNGGFKYNSPAKGGFGGGGAGTEYGRNQGETVSMPEGSGGGGGYTGGAAGRNNGQGGTSFLANSATSVPSQTASGVRSGNGLVNIVPIGSLPSNATMPTTATMAVYNTSASATVRANASDTPGNSFGFSFTTSAAGTFSSYEFGVNNPGGGNGSFALVLQSNSSNNTPGSILQYLQIVNDSNLNTGAGFISGSGNNYQLSAHTTYWLVGYNSDGSSGVGNLQLISGNGEPNIGYENQFVYDTSISSTQSYLNSSQGLAPVGQVEVFVCFCTGTLIETSRGDVAVEALQVGDLVVTSSGAERPVAWTSHRTIARPSLEACPVRVCASAFGPELPERDLYLSPGHPVLVGADEHGTGGHLVPIMCLINGTTIGRVAVDSVTYWHVELDQHDILLAEGLPAESYIDLGSRPWFDGADGTLYDPDMALPGMPGRCRPVAVDGSVVEAERRRLDQVFTTRLASAAAWPDMQNALLAMF